jgi:hypothetical protein
MAVDASFASVSALLHFYEAVGSASVQNFGHTRKGAYLSAALSAAQTKFDGNSLYLGAGGALWLPAQTEFDLGASDFTIEMWLYIIGDNTNASEAALCGVWNSGGATSYVLGYKKNGATNSLLIYSSGGNFNSAAYTLPTGAWLHLAIDRTGTTTKWYVDGALAATIACAATFTAIGWGSTAMGFGGGANANAYITEARITKGVRRYTGAFTPPSAPFPNGPYELSGTVDNLGAPCERTVLAYRRDSGALFGRTKSDATTGAYALSTNYSGEHSVVCLDDAAGTLQNDLVIRVTPA